MQKAGLLLTLGLLPSIAIAENSWFDEQHSEVKSTLNRWSNSIDSWFGEPDPTKPASANLRIILDNEWNRYDGYSFKPRIRGKIRLPALKQRFSLVFGDDRLDDEITDNRMSTNYKHPLPNNKYHDRQQIREDNSSLAVRWSKGIKSLGIDTDADIGIRAINDPFLRLKAKKEWTLAPQWKMNIEPIYRYGLKSEHRLHANFETHYFESDSTQITNHFQIGYRYKNSDSDAYWGNSLSRKHRFAGNKQLNYGVAIGGEIDKKQATLNRYGPFINWRQPLFTKWFFVQPEVNFYNNRKENYKHTLGVFLRLETIF